MIVGDGRKEIILERYLLIVFCLACLSVLIARWIHKEIEVLMALAACDDQQVPRQFTVV